jgi:hypothetical protein
MLIKNIGPIWFARPIYDPSWITDKSSSALIDLNSGRLLAYINLQRIQTSVTVYLPMWRAFRLHRQARYVFGDAILGWVFPRLELFVGIDGDAPLDATQRWVEAALGM